MLALALRDATNQPEARRLLELALIAHRALGALDDNAQAKCDAARILEFAGDEMARDPSGQRAACARWRDSARLLDSIGGDGGPTVCRTGGTGVAGVTARLLACP